MYKKKAVSRLEASGPSKLLLALESKHEKFIRLANRRARAAIKQLRALGRLGTSAYERTPDEIDKLREVLQKELDAALDRLNRPVSREAESDIL